jgi:hypothetical protein
MDYHHKPPAVFRQAALACRSMSSDESFKKLEENGARWFVHPDEPQPLPTTFWGKIKTRLKKHLPPL